MSKRFIAEADKEGKLTIPAELCRMLGSRHLEISFDEANKCLKVVPVESKMEKLIGSLSTSLSFRELRTRAERLLSNETRR